MLAPILYVHELTTVALRLCGAYFFSELVMGPMWAIPMVIAPAYAGTASGLMNIGGALANMATPLVAGALIDWTGNWKLPFVISMGFFVMGGLLAFTMKPNEPLEVPKRHRAA